MSLRLLYLIFVQLCGWLALLGRRRQADPLPPAELADKLYIAIDGTGIPRTGAETAGATVYDSLTDR